MNKSKFEIFKSNKNDEYYFRLRSENNEIILASEGYKTKQSSQNGIDSVKKNATNENNFERIDDIANNNYTFNLKANNGEIIGRSENYTTKKARENGISTVKRNAQDSPIEDMTK